MSRVDLRVPFFQKDEAKGLGARWDGTKKVWYVPEGVATEPFLQWLADPTEELTPNLRADSYYIAEACRPCWRCRKDSRIYAFILPAGYEAFQVADNAEEETWEAYRQPSLLSYVSLLSDQAQDVIYSLTPHYRLDYSKTIENAYWMNHCEQCGAKQGDFDTIEEYGSAFQPTCIEDARKVMLREVNEPFCGRASYYEYNSSMEFFGHMPKLGGQFVEPNGWVDAFEEGGGRPQAALGWLRCLWNFLQRLAALLRRVLGGKSAGND